MTTRFFGDCPATAVSSLDHADSVDARLPLLPDDLTIHYDEAAQPRGLGGRAGINASFPYPNLVRIRARAKTFFADDAAKYPLPLQKLSNGMLFGTEKRQLKSVSDQRGEAAKFGGFSVHPSPMHWRCVPVLRTVTRGAVGAPTGAKTRRHGSRLAAASERRALGHVVARGAAHRRKAGRHPWGTRPEEQESGFDHCGTCSPIFET